MISSPLRAAVLRAPARRAATAALSTEAGGWFGPSEQLIDVHTHVYLPRYMQMLRDRAEVPRVLNVEGEDRLVILPGEDEEVTTATGRPIGGEYYDPARKLAFMDMHGIDISVLSLANPWLDFLTAEEAIPLAALLNEDMEDQCEASAGRFYGFGVIPGQSVEGSCAELQRIAEQPHMRGIILSTNGLGKGLDDPDLLPVYQEIERLGLVIFLHPHYGVGTEHFGGYGHALFLALGFTFETTVAVSRLICSGMLDKVPELKLLLAHTGGTLPFLAGRLDSCVQGDAHIAENLEHDPSHYLKRMYYDSISYHTPTLNCGIDFAGDDRLMFGTDHPFFPPPIEDQSKIDTVPWPSTTKNIDLLRGHASMAEVMADNAIRILNLERRE